MKNEYKFVTEQDQEKFLAALNEHGAEGWSAVMIQPGGNNTAYMQREVQVEPPAAQPAAGTAATGEAKPES